MKYKGIFYEFIRYIFIGGTAFLLDILVLYLFKTRIFSSMGNIGVYISTALGFMAGLVYNYIFSLIFVFESARDQKKGINILSFFLFVLIGLIGLFLTEAGMYAGINFLNLDYILTKIIVAAIVLIWNYAARKILIFT